MLLKTFGFLVMIDFKVTKNASVQSLTTQNYGFATEGIASGINRTNDVKFFLPGFHFRAMLSGKSPYFYRKSFLRYFKFPLFRHPSVFFFLKLFDLPCSLKRKFFSTNLLQMEIKSHILPLFNNSFSEFLI